MTVVDCSCMVCGFFYLWLKNFFSHSIDRVPMLRVLLCLYFHTASADKDSESLSDEGTESEGGSEGEGESEEGEGGSEGEEEEGDRRGGGRRDKPYSHPRGKLKEGKPLHKVMYFDLCIVGNFKTMRVYP